MSRAVLLGFLLLMGCSYPTDRSPLREVDAVAFEVLRSEPEDGAQDVDPTVIIRLTLSQPPHLPSVTAGSVSVTSGTASAEVLRQVEGADILLTPAEELVGGVRYDVVVTEELLSTLGHPLTPATFSFFVREEKP